MLGTDEFRPLAAIQSRANGLPDLPVVTVRHPIGGIAESLVADKAARAEAAFRAWRSVPAPRRGELVRRFGELVRAHKDPLGRLVSIEAGDHSFHVRGDKADDRAIGAALAGEAAPFVRRVAGAS